MSEENGLPETWTTAQLGAFTDVIGGSTPSRNEPSYFGGNIVWLTPTEVPKNTVSIILDSKEKLTDAGFKKGGVRWIPTNSVLLTSRASIGYVAIAGTQLTTNQGFASFSLPNGIEPKYLGWWLRSQKSILEDLAGGTTFKEISKTVLREIFVPIAPENEQHRIVTAIEQQFTRLDAAVAALQHAKAKLKRYRASVLKAAVEGKLTEAWRAEHSVTEPASVLLERILVERRAKWEADLKAKGKDPAKVKYVEPARPDVEGLPVLPEGWCWARAEQICDFITKGTTPSAENLYSMVGEIPFIKVYNLTNYGSLDFSVNPTYISKQTHYHDLARSKVFPGDVLMNIVGPPLGKVSIVPDICPEWNINQAIAIFRPMPGYDRNFLCLSLLTDQILSWAIRRAKATAGQFNLTLEICRDLPLPLPPLLEQQEIASEVERRLSIVTQIEATVNANLKRAERLRQSILKEAFAGRLVPQDPNDEPASVLLERIHKEREGQKQGPIKKARPIKTISAPRMPDGEPMQIDASEMEQMDLWANIGSRE